MKKLFISLVLIFAIMAGTVFASITFTDYKKIYQGMGFTKGSKVGNMILLFHVEFPEKLSEEQIIKLDAIL